MFENNDHNDILLIYFLQTENAQLSSQTDIQFEVVRNYGRPLILKDLVQGKINNNRIFLRKLYHMFCLHDNTDNDIHE